MLVGIYHDWSALPEAQASTPERTGRVRSFQDGGVHTLKLNLAESSEFGVNPLSWLNKYWKYLFVVLQGTMAGALYPCGKVALKSVSFFLGSSKKKPRPKGRGFSI